MDRLYARKSQKGKFQELSDHSNAVANSARDFAPDYLKDAAYVAGLFHDVGKSYGDWQEYLLAGGRKNGQETVPHAARGAEAAFRKLQTLQDGKQDWPFICLPILGHHAGLPDREDLLRFCDNAKKATTERNKPQWEPEFPADYKSLSLPGGILLIQDPNRRRTAISNAVAFSMRMQESCIVDGDWSDAKDFDSPATTNPRYDTVPSLSARMEAFTDSLKTGNASGDVMAVRAEVLKACEDAVTKPKGVYFLAAPTGSGKTAASMRFALGHAACHGMDRVIVAIPFTSVISQTASVLRKALGGNNVMEIHSGVEECDSEPLRDAAEKMDAPVIVTTNNRLFETAYSGKPSKVRAFHNFANSVIILDEVQSVPTDMLQSVVDALEYLVNCCGCTVLFTTASMPVLGSDVKRKFEGFRNITPLMDPEHPIILPPLYEVKDETDSPLSFEGTAEKMVSFGRSVMCIVNKKSTAREVFNFLPKDGHSFHLSRNMTSEHIDKVLTEVKDLLDKGEIVRLVTTSLVEAGVDIDFPVVMREKAGFDSMVQAAGRCNREGKLEKGTFVMFSFNEVVKVPSNRRMEWNAYREASRNLPNGGWNPEDKSGAMRKYFSILFSKQPTFDRYNTRILQEKMDFRTLSDCYDFLENSTVRVFVPEPEEGERLLKEITLLATKGRNYGKLARKMGRHMVGVWRTDYGKLKVEGNVSFIPGTEIPYLADMEMYDKNTGLDTKKEMEKVLIV